MKMSHVLIGLGEALPAAEVVFSLLDAGYKVSAFSRKGDIPLHRLKLEALHIIPAPENDAASAISALREIMTAPSAPDMVLPLDDIGLWLCAQALPDDERIAGAIGENAQIALDKTLQIQIANSAGLQVPETIFCNNADDLDQVSKFPSILKPALALRLKSGRILKDKVRYIMSQEDIPAAQTELKENGGPFLVQPLIAGAGEGVFGFCGRNGVTNWSAHRRLRMMNPHGSGSSSCQSILVDPELRDLASNFLARAQWRGSFMLEFLRDPKGVPWFMELNGRMWGSMALSRRMGFEYPAWNAMLCNSAEFSPNPVARDFVQITQRNLGREILHLLHVLRGPKSEFHREHWPRFLTSAIGVLTPTHPRHYYNYDPSNKGFFLRDAAWTIRSAFRT